MNRRPLCHRNEIITIDCRVPQIAYRLIVVVFVQIDWLDVTVCNTLRFVVVVQQVEYVHGNV